MSDHDVYLMDRHLDDCGLDCAIAKEAMQSMAELRKTVIDESFYGCEELAQHWARKQHPFTFGRPKDIPHNFVLEEWEVAAILKMEDAYLAYYIYKNYSPDRPDDE